MSWTNKDKSHDARNKSQRPSPAFAIPSHPYQILILIPPQSRSSSRQILLPLPSHRLKRSSVDFPRSKPRHTAAAQQLLFLPTNRIKQLSAAFSWSLPTSYSKFPFCAIPCFSSSIKSFCDPRIPLIAVSEVPHPTCPALSLEPPGASAKSPAM
jgi:hypothetical protein